MAYRVFGAALPTKPTSPLCTLSTGVPTTYNTDGKAAWFYMTSATPGTFWVPTGIRAAKFAEF